MNKRELAKLKRPEIKKDIIAKAEQLEDKRYLVTTENIVIENDNVLVINFYERKEILENVQRASIRTFLTANDYISQDLKVTNTKWKTGKLDNLLGWYWWDRTNGYDGIFVTDDDYKKAKKFIEKYINEKDKCIWKAFSKFQDQILEERLNIRRKKELDIIDQKMLLVPELPQNFEEWLHDYGMYESRYIIYESGTKKNLINGYCTHCKKRIKIDKKIVIPRNGEKGKCSNCGSDITYRAHGLLPGRINDTHWICILQKIEQGFIARYFDVSLQIYKEDYKEDFYYGERCRKFFEGDKTTVFEWGVYKQRGLSRWCPENDKWYCTDAIVYTENLPEVLSETEYKYSALDIYQKKTGYKPIPIWNFLTRFPYNRYIEYFIKMGMTNMVNDVVNGRIYDLNDQGKNPVEVLQIPKEHIKLLAEMNGTAGIYELLKQCAADKILPKREDLEKFYEKFGERDELLGLINIHMSIGSFIRYMDKQFKSMPEEQENQGCHMCMPANYTKEERVKMKYRNLATDWKDYISWCAQLKYDMNDNYVLLPPDFKKAHDRVMKEYKDNQDKIKQEKKKKFEKMIRETLKEMKNIPALKMNAKGLMIVVPESAEELKEEGNCLHHCVGTYVERVAKGETMILFIRKTDNPTKSYFTLEYKNGKVIQCRGKNNCDMTDKVKAFVNAFEKKMQESEKEDGKVAS